jgi:hypothetical protein
MSVRAIAYPANGMHMDRWTAENGAGRFERTNALGRLVQLMRLNEGLLGRAEVLRGRLLRAREYASDPLSDSRLGNALLEHTRAGYAAVLGELRSNRAEALSILRDCGHAEAC